MSQGVPAPDNDRESFAAEPASPRAARTFATEFLSLHAAPIQITRDLTLVVSELVTNFVEHSNGRRVDVIFDLGDPLWWDIEVIGGSAMGDKRMPDLAQWTLADAQQISGRGLGIVRQLMDDVVIDVRTQEVSVRCRRHRAAPET